MVSILVLKYQYRPFFFQVEKGRSLGKVLGKEISENLQATRGLKSDTCQQNWLLVARSGQPKNQSCSESISFQ